MNKRQTSSAAAEAAAEIIRNINEILRLFEQSVNSFYYNKFRLEAQHPAGLLSISCLSYNKRSNWLTIPF